MLDKLIAYFSKAHLLTNLIMVIVFVGGVFSWQQTRKEEWPDIISDTIRISVSYPGASAADVEYFVTKPIEEEVRGLDGVDRITSTSSVGQSSVSVELEPDCPDVEMVITDIRNAVLDVDLPEEVVDDPHVRVFRSSKKAILDIALYNENVHLLDTDQRRELQKYVFSLENQLLNLPQVNSIDKRGYLKEEIQIKTYPKKLLKYELPFNTVMQEIKNNHIRKPAGTIEATREPKVTLLSELDSAEKLKGLVIEGGFEGKTIQLGEVSEIVEGYEKNKQIVKVNGHEAVIMNVVKNSSSGILEALSAVNGAVATFKENHLSGTPIGLTLLDDESTDVRNRIKLISTNGIIGFVLILISLFVFLSKRAGVWVALGIPFTLGLTMLFAPLFNQTINGMTLAAVIIVMGMIVDDAIVVAENITRLQHQGVPTQEAVVKGTSFVLLPIVASILTTCIAFVPLYFFEGRYGNFVRYIPLIIFFMLGASLFESILILPGHMGLFAERAGNKANNIKHHWFEKIETLYGNLLLFLLPRKTVVLSFFLILLVLAAGLCKAKMKFVMFPNEETREIVISGATPPDTDRYETSRRTKQIENVLTPYLGKEVVGYRTSIARSRRGGAVEENKFRMIIEIVPKEERRKSADQLLLEFKKAILPLPGFEKLMFQKSRWGHGSGSPIELVVQQNNDALRKRIVNQLVDSMRSYKPLKNVEVDRALWVPEYQVDINREKIKRLSINPVDIASTFRAALEGTILYEFSNGDEDVQVRFTTVDEAKDDIDKVLDLPVENEGNYLVPLRDVVYVKKIESANSISRRDLKRTTLIDADIAKGAKMTPIEVAEYFEKNIFPHILKEYPTTTLSFGGEVEDTRESKDDLKNAIVLTIGLIFIVLCLLFNSLVKPLIIMISIPFGVVGIIFTFLLHGKLLFGFYAAVGALGLAGVVVNDSIIMLSKLTKEYDGSRGKEDSDSQIADIAKTRLRAVLLTTLTTVVGVLPTAYGFAGYDAMLAEMMLALAWGLVFGTLITLLLIPCLYSAIQDLEFFMKKKTMRDTV